MEINEISVNRYDIEPSTVTDVHSYYRVCDMISYTFDVTPVLTDYTEITELTKLQLADGMYVIDMIEVLEDEVTDRSEEVVLVLSKYEDCKRKILENILCADRRGRASKECNIYDGIRNEWHVKLAEIKLVYNELLSWVNSFLGNLDITEEHPNIDVHLLHKYKQLEHIADSCEICRRCDKETLKLSNI